GDGLAGRGDRPGRRRRAGTALHQGPDRGAPVRAPPGSVQRSFIGLRGHEQLSFYGAGGESLGTYGHSKDHRADLKQMILAVVIDGDGRPICTEMLPGNTADAIVLLAVVARLRERFHIGRVCVVADRGMISAATITALESASWNTFSAPASAAAPSSAVLCSRTSGP